MVKLKKDWMSVVIIGLLVVIILFLFNLKGTINELQAKSDKIADTLETTEGVVIGVDGGTQDINTRLKGVESQVNYIVNKVRRRK